MDNLFFTQLFDGISKEWMKVLYGGSAKKKLNLIIKKISTDINGSELCPDIFNIFRCFRMEFKNTKIVIIGQDPYHTRGVATGLAFSCNKTIQPSIKKIHKVLVKNKLAKNVKLQTGNLDMWKDQGVLLLNMSLTTLVGMPGHHNNIWKDYVHTIIDRLNILANNSDMSLIYILWGKRAQVVKENCSKKTKHIFLKCSHPASYLKKTSKDNFLKNTLFIKVNEIMECRGKTPINWDFNTEQDDEDDEDGEENNSDNDDDSDKENNSGDDNDDDSDKENNSGDDSDDDKENNSDEDSDEDDDKENNSDEDSDEDDDKENNSDEDSDEDDDKENNSDEDSDEDDDKENNSDEDSDEDDDKENNSDEDSDEDDDKENNSDEDSDDDKDDEENNSDGGSDSDKDDKENNSGDDSDSDDKDDKENNSDEDSDDEDSDDKKNNSEDDGGSDDKDEDGEENNSEDGGDSDGSDDSDEDDIRELLNNSGQGKKSKSPQNNILLFKKYFTSEPKTCICFTDGSCNPNKKCPESVGGYALMFTQGPFADLAIYGNIGTDKHYATNIRAEGTAILETLKYAYDRKKLWDKMLIVTDCMVWRDLIKFHMESWSESDFSAKSNPDLTRQIRNLWIKLSVLGSKTVDIMHMKSHNKDGWKNFGKSTHERYCYIQNEYVDYLCTIARKCVKGGTKKFHTVQYTA